MRAIVPGKPTESELVARILDSDPDVIMPPPESNHVLTKKQKEIQCMDSEWCGIPASLGVRSSRKTHDPEDVNDGWALNWIDHFIFDRLTKRYFTSN